MEPALSPEHPGERDPIHTDQAEKERSSRPAHRPRDPRGRSTNAISGHHAGNSKAAELRAFMSSADRHPTRSPRTTDMSPSAALGNAMTTRSNDPSATSRDRQASRISRLARFRATAPPTRLPATNATRTPWSEACSGPSATNTWTRAPDRRRPRRSTARMSADRRRRRTGLTRPGAREEVGMKRGSGGDPGPALCPATSQEGASGPGPHADAEPVGLLPPAVVRLERSLGHVTLS